MVQCLCLPNSVTVLILTTPICRGTIESPLVPSSPTRWRELAVFPLAERTVRLTACAHGSDSSSVPTVCCRNTHTHTHTRCTRVKSRTDSSPVGHLAAGAHICDTLTHQPCAVLDTVYTLNQQEVMSVPVTWETETVAKIP